MTFSKAEQLKGKTQRQRRAKVRREERRDRKIIAEGSPMCVKCGERPAVDVDHIKNRKMGGTWNPAILGIENMQPLCRECHDGKKGTSED